MPQTKIQRFFSKYPSRVYDTGVILVLPGEDPPGVMWIESGQITTYEVSPSGEKIVINAYKNPAFFPMSWAINREQNRYFYEVAARAVIKVAPPEEVVEFLDKNPDITMDLLARVYRGTEGLLKRMSLLMGGSARARVIFELIVSAKRFGEKLPKNSYETAITEAELGARCGLSRETVSREINKLKSSGYIRIRRGSMTIDNLPKLEELLESES